MHSTPNRTCAEILGIQKSLSIQRSHAAASRAGDRLPVDMVLNVACGEYAGDAGHSGVAILRRPSFDVAISHRQLAIEESRVGLVSDRNKAAFDFDQLAGGP